MTASSSLQLTDAFTAMRGGRHNDLLPSQTQPVAGAATTLLFALSASSAAVTVNGSTTLQALLLSKSGIVTLTLPASLYEDDLLSSKSQWTVTFFCPFAPFRLQVIGSLASSHQPFQRSWSQGFISQSLTVSLPTNLIAMSALPLGGVTHVPFNVTNSGPSNSILLSVVTDPIALTVSLTTTTLSASGDPQWLSLLPRSVQKGRSSTLAAPPQPRRQFPPLPHSTVQCCCSCRAASPPSWAWSCCCSQSWRPR